MLEFGLPVGDEPPLGTLSQLVKSVNFVVVDCPVETIWLLCEDAVSIVVVMYVLVIVVAPALVVMRNMNR